MSDTVTFKAQQILRVGRMDQRAEGGQRLPEGVRVVVTSSPEKGKTKVKVQDPQHPNLYNVRAILPNEVFQTTQRGRPRKNPEPETATEE